MLLLRLKLDTGTTFAKLRKILDSEVTTVSHVTTSHAATVWDIGINTLKKTTTEFVLGDILLKVLETFQNLESYCSDGVMPGDHKVLGGSSKLNPQ